MTIEVSNVFAQLDAVFTAARCVSALRAAAGRPAVVEAVIEDARTVVERAQCRDADGPTRMTLADWLDSLLDALESEATELRAELELRKREMRGEP